MAHSTSENDSKANIVTKEELDFLLDDYYDARGWTKEGVPTQEKLRQLNMEEDVKN
jgi:aldehyde:ferredoxin oxidoreductase